VHQKKVDGTLREIHAASGGPWGGTCVDKAYFDFLGDLVGQKTMKTFKAEKLGEFVEMERAFEIKKRTITPETKDKITFKIPGSLCEIFLDCSNCSSIKDAVSQTKYAKDVEWSRDKMRVKTDLIKSLFEPTINKITDHIEQILAVVEKVDVILLVGGFSESRMVDEAIRTKFPKYKIINPDEAGLAVLRGAVIFGHKPKAISSRVTRYTYGYEAWPLFLPGVHPEEKKISYHGVDSCREVFQIYVKKGTEIKSGDVITSHHKPVSDEQTDMEIRLYVSPETSPMFVTNPNVRSLGTVTFPLPSVVPGSNREIMGRLYFGETELIFEAQDLQSRTIHKAELKCL